MPSLCPFEEHQEELIATYTGKGKTREDAEEIAEDKDLWTFYIPKHARWSDQKNLKTEIGNRLDNVLYAIEAENPD